MLAPLKDRAILEREPDAGELATENAALKQALRLARQNQKRMATLNAQRIVALTNELATVSERNRQLAIQIQRFESGQAMIEMGRQLMQLRMANDQLSDAAREVWCLDRNLCAAHRECERLAAERDTALARLAVQRDLQGD